MKVFHCGHCDQLVFFENNVCVNCGHTLAYLADRAEMGTLEPDGDVWRTVDASGKAQQYRLCANYAHENVCNWAVPIDDPNPFCLSCRLTRTIPDLNRSGAREAWAKLEAAKRRLVHGLTVLKLPVVSKLDQPEDGLAFDFLADPDPESGVTAPVLTGHENGLITINIAEADDVEREKRRSLMHEPYRTILGHFRHEVGHYYWDRLVRDSPSIDEFRQLFGDERADYAQALQRHYENGAPSDWMNSYVSTYASCHPFEDWAESWAHYQHMMDTLETAVDCGLTLRPKRSDEPSLKPNIQPEGLRRSAFNQIIEKWFPLTYILNNLNRGMGLPDAYPFVISSAAIDKLAFIHEVVSNAGQSRQAASAPPQKPAPDYIAAQKEKPAQPEVMATAS